MDKKIWYEVYLSDCSGSHTLENGICKTYEEAKILKEKFKKTIHCGTIYIDKWQNRDNPTRLAGLE